MKIPYKWKFCYSRNGLSLFLCVKFYRVKHLKSDCIERYFVFIFLKTVSCYKETVEHDFKFVLIRCLKLKDFKNKMDILTKP